MTDDPWLIGRGSRSAQTAGRWLKNVPQVIAIGRVTETNSVIGSLVAIQGSNTIIQIGRVTESESARKLSTVVQIGRITETETVRTLGVSVDLASARLRVPAGTVATDLSNFVTKLNLADLPDALWDEIGADGSYFAVRQAGAEQPLDLVNLDSGTRSGYGFFRASLQTAVDNEFTLVVRSGVNGQPVETDPTGRNAVWSDYDVMVDYSDGLDRTGQGRDPVVSGVVGSNYVDSLVHGSMNSSQGLAWDGTNWYGINTTSIKKYNAAYTNTLTVADTRIVDSRLLHCGGSVVHDGELFVTVSQYPSRLGPIGVAVFDCATLAYSRFYDLTAYVPDAAGICWNADASAFGVVAGIDNAGTNIYLFDEDFNHLSDLVPPRTIPGTQGITYRDGFYYLMSGPIGVASTIYKVADDMSTALAVWKGGAHLQDLENPGPGTNDLWFSNKSNELRLLTYAAAGADPDDLNWLNLAGFGYAVVSGLPKRTQWTMGATVKLAGIPSSTPQPVLSYSSFTTTDSHRAVLYARSAQWSIYNSSDSNAFGTTAITAGDVDVRRRVHHTQDGTANRKLYRQGVLEATDVGTSQRPAGTDGSEALFLGTEDLSSAEHLLGALSFVYLRNGELTPEWLAAEQASWEGAGFYQVFTEGEPQVVAIGRVSETDAPRTLTVVAGEVTRPIFRISETESARALGVAGTLTQAIGRVVESDQVRALTGTSTFSAVVGRLEEVEQAFALGSGSGGFSRVIGRLSETDQLFGLGVTLGGHQAAIGRVEEISEVQPLSMRLIFAHPIQTVVETETLRPLGHVRSIGMVEEVESLAALEVLATFQETLSRILETEDLQPLVPVLTFEQVIGGLEEHEELLPLGISVELGRLGETSEARALAIVRSIVRERVVVDGVEYRAALAGIWINGQLIPAHKRYWNGERYIDFVRELVPD